MAHLHFKTPRLCEVTECDGFAVAHGLCHKHFLQRKKGLPLKRKGEPMPREQKPWEFENPQGEAELAAMTAAGEEDNAK